MLISMFFLQEKDKQVNATLHNRPMYVYTISLSGSAERCFTFFTVVSVSAILSCRPFFILIFLLCIKMKHYGFSRKSIWKNLETFP